MALEPAQEEVDEALLWTVQVGGRLRGEVGLIELLEDLQLAPGVTSGAEHGVQERVVRVAACRRRGSG